MGLSLSEILSAAQGYILAVLLLYAVFTDCREHKIHNLPTFCGLLAGLGLSWLRGGWNGVSAGGIWAKQVCLCDSLTAAAVLFAVFFVAYLLGGLGAGDVKLAAAVGALTGVQFSLWAALYTALAGLPIALFLLVWRGDLRGGLQRAARCSFRWRRRAETPPAAGDGGARADNPHPTANNNVMPYALAMALGVAWAVWAFWRAGQTLPVF